MSFSKNFMPPELKKVQPRERLYSFFEDKKVVIIEAGPGFGKSAAVYDFIKKSKNIILNWIEGSSIACVEILK